MIDLPKDYKFIDAYFTNNDRTIVEVVWSDTNNELHIEIIEAKDGDKAWERLLEHASIDNIHERTYEFIREQNKVYEEEVIRIAKERGLLYNVNEIDSQLYEVLVKILFKEYDQEKDKKELFMFKLQLFELDFVKQCTDNDLKRNLRKAENFIDAVSVTIDIKKSL